MKKECLLFFGLLALCSTCLGCTWVTVQPLSGGEVVARTMELGGTAVNVSDGTIEEELDWGLKKVPAGTPINPDLHKAGNSCKAVPIPRSNWTVGISHVGIGGFDQKNEGFGTIYDGINMQGLTVDVLSLRQSVYMLPKAVPKQSIVLCYTSFAAWLLGNFGTVAEVRAALENTSNPVFVIAPHSDDTSTYIHWALSDAHRNSLVIEILDGQMKLHDNTVRVLTNDPPFDFHLQNINNYINLNTNWQLRPSIEVNTEIGTVPFQVNHGHNTLGLPGDYTPTGRFIRAFYLRQFGETNVAIQNMSDAIQLAQSVLNSVYIPKGVVAHKKSESSYDFTQYATLKVPGESALYFRTYADLQWRKIDLANLNFKSTPQLARLYAFDSPPKDVTHEVFP